MADRGGDDLHHDQQQEKNKIDAHKGGCRFGGAYQLQKSPKIAHNAKSLALPLYIGILNDLYDFHFCVISS